MPGSVHGCPINKHDNFAQVVIGMRKCRGVDFSPTRSLSMFFHNHVSYTSEDITISSHSESQLNSLVIVMKFVVLMVI